MKLNQLKKRLNTKLPANLSGITAYLSVAIGVALFVHGLWMFWKPSAYILGGLLLAGTGFFSGLEDKCSDGEDWQ